MSLFLTLGDLWDWVMFAFVGGMLGLSIARDETVFAVFWTVVLAVLVVGRRAYDRKQLSKEKP